MSTARFPDRARTDAFDKVRDATAYAADLQLSPARTSSLACSTP
jgi:hypothetical protein